MSGNCVCQECGKEKPCDMNAFCNKCSEIKNKTFINKIGLNLLNKKIEPNFFGSSDHNIITKEK